MRPWNHPTTRSAASHCHRPPEQRIVVKAFVHGAVLPQHGLDWSSVKAGPRNAACMRRGPGQRRRAGFSHPPSGCARRPKPSQGSARIAGGRLNPQSLEDAFAQERPLATQFQRHAAGQTQLRQAGHVPRVPGQAEHRLFGHDLNRPGDIEVARFEGAFRADARAAEEADEPLVGHRGAAQEMESTPKFNHTDPSSLRSSNSRRNDLRVAGFAVGSKTHQLVLARVIRNPQ